MTDAFAARAQLDRARTEADTAQARADEQEAVVRRLRAHIQAGLPEPPFPPSSADALAAAEAALPELQRAAEESNGLAASAQEELTRALGEGESLFPDDNTAPIALLPVRVETIWWEPRTLRVRIYPDDLLLSRFEPELTPAETAAGTAYWQNPGPEAWQKVLTELRPARASWAVRACRPGAPQPAVRPEDPGAHRTRAVSMPKRWRFLGLFDGQVVVDKLGRPVPDPLPIGLLRAEEEGWETDWFEAVKAGMGIELVLPPENTENLDQLLVVGVRDDGPADGAARLRDLLHGHRFGGGLGLLPSGTATNNTPRARSGWSSAPAYPGPDPDPEAGERPVADALAAALGLPDAGFLRGCPGAADTEPSAVAALTLLTWPTLGKGFAEAALKTIDLGTQQVNRVAPAGPWRAIRDHLADHVRGRGPLPMLRAGRQPYGVLPATALDDWRAERVDDVDGLIAPWLLRLRERSRAALNNPEAIDPVPRVEQGRPVDQVAVEALQRLPVATGLAMIRMNRPGRAVSRTPLDEPPATLGLPGLSPDGMLRWTTRSDGWTSLGWGLDQETGVPEFATRLCPDPEAFPARATATADYLDAVRAFLAGELDAEAFDLQWPVELSTGRDTPPRRSTFFDLPMPADEPDGEEEQPGEGEVPPEGEGPVGGDGGVPPEDDEAPPQPPEEPEPDMSGVLDALLFLPNWSTFLDDFDPTDDPLRQALAVLGDVDQLVADVLEGLDERERDERVAAAHRAAGALPRLEQALRTLAAVPVTRLPELLAEVVDVHAHRLDAWITSLASKRLAELRASGAEGVRFGCYGWVEDLRPPEPREQLDIELDDVTTTVEVSAKDGYIHAPSLHHAATAAVLRSGFLGNPDEQSYAVNLTSRRTRIARWLLGGVRQGQNLGSLLGYRFERALHDAELDHLIERFRRQFPVPVVPETPAQEPDADLWARSAEAISARNVVDGMALARAGAGAPDQASVIDQAPVVGSDTDRAAVTPLLDDLADALDAVGDLVLAESVHQLVGGNPIRAGLTADTLGRGEDVPDTFRVLSTPHRARALTHRTAALFPAEPATPTGWPADPLAALQPALESWVAHLLGPAEGWTLAGRLGGGQDDARPFELTADRLGSGALSTVLDAAAVEPAGLRRAVQNAMGVTPDTPVTWDGPGWSALHGRAARIRSLLSTAQPLLPSHLPEDPGGRSVDTAGLRTRLAAFAAGPLVAGHPAGAGLRDLAAEQVAPESADSWLSRARTALSEVLGADIPLLPGLTAPTPPPEGRGELPGAAVEDWLRRNAAVRPPARTLHETLLLAGNRAGRVERLRAAQHPTSDGDAWIGGTFPAGQRPPATTHLVWHAPADIPPGAAVTGVVLDEWIELLPGSDQLPPGPDPAPQTELTGVAFHYDRPDAKAPHNLLIAVPPDLSRGWTSDGLVQVVRETLELAKLRAVDSDDLPALGALLPAVRIAHEGATGRALGRIETKRDDSDQEGPFQLQVRHRTSDVEAGLAARVHDPLWLLTRQWQFGEFTAQDAGSPAVVRMTGSSAPIDAWRPDGAADWVPYRLAHGPLDTQIEDEPVRVDERLRAEGGAALLRMCDEAGLLTAALTALAPHRLPAGEPDTGLVGLLDGRMPDAQSVAAALDAGTFDTGPDPRLGEVAARWRSWWAGQLAEHGPDCFDPHRCEYAAELSTGGTVLRAEEYQGDGLDWYSLDVHPDPEAGAAPQGPSHAFTEEGLPSTVRYGGLPADRYWETEDALVDLGATDVSTLDTGRLLLISFATVFGNDWFLVPLEVPTASLTVLDQLLVRDVFGRQHLVRRAGREDPSWSMFTLDSPDPDHPAASGLLILPTERGQTGQPLEHVVLARDDLANLAWAVQHHYTDGRGEPVDRRDRWARGDASVPDTVGELPAYAVQSIVPDYWFPLVPEPVRAGRIRFRLAALTGPGLDSRPEGRLITPGLWLHEEEVPREGIRVVRRPVLARWSDGSWHSWVRREKTPGTGESSSGLAFDTVRPTEPWP
ncbi:hypothetical protein [Streptomyces griseoloalbus]|uniref:Uncharacterized protein n=1 Tax=Streptomyces griseoloalbus TaxID=67303 RepID=A0A7W8BK63_9ACTN|nr:hypothetical protein [Streptomyces albaduncus]MBB5124740.1 hypothetical protein [Streptomyces albaduncus]GGW39073.1 hypothetical protein GCM10010340_16110 [Streptomyces albaduncus]